MLPEIQISLKDDARRSPGQVPTGRALPAAPSAPVNAPSSALVKVPTSAKVTGGLLTLAVWGGLAYLIVKAARGIRGK